MSTTSKVAPGRDAALGEVAQHLGVGVRDAHEGRPRAAGLERLQRLGGAPPRCARRGVGIGSPCGIARGVAELGGDQLLELLGEDVLEHLGLVVHAIPGHAERLGQVELEQAVVAQDLERHPDARAAVSCDAAVGLVGDQPQRVEAA